MFPAMFKLTAVTIGALCITVGAAGVPLPEVANDELGDKMKAVEAALEPDLAAKHFEGQLRLSDPAIQKQKPIQGFVRIQHLKGLHIIHMSVRKEGNRRVDFFATSLPEKSPLLQGKAAYYSQWAEVAYLLDPKPHGSTGKGANEQKLYSLHRIVRLLAPSNAAANNARILRGNPGYEGMSTKPGSNPLNFNSPVDVTIPNNRTIDLGNPPCTRDTLLLPDVLSFRVRMLAPGKQTDLPNPELGYYESSYTEHGNVSSIEVTIKVWDAKARKARDHVIKHKW